MDQEQDINELQKKLAQRSINNIKFQNVIEEPADKIYGIVQVSDEEGKDLGVISFTRWTHEESMRIYKLPFFIKIQNNQDLDDTEQKQYLAFQREMVLDAITDKGRWIDVIQKNNKLVQIIFDRVAATSGIDKNFMDNLDAFMNTDEGFSYGYLWFILQGRTPSEIGKLPETDVLTVNLWAQKWSERLKSNVRV